MTATRLPCRWWNTRTHSTIGSIDAHPGHLTIGLKRNGEISRRMSVNASSGAVLCSTWHGAFIALEDS